MGTRRSNPAVPPSNGITLPTRSSISVSLAPADADIVHVHPGSTPDWSNLDILERNRLPTRAYFHPHATAASARQAAEDRVAYEKSVRSGGDPALRQLLSGPGTKWKFCISPSPFKGPLDFHQLAEPPHTWPDIQVPGMWQLRGFGKGPQYLNSDYPFPVDPPNVPYDDNECGRYVHSFRVLDRFASPDTVFRLRFEGVDSAFSVWLNGRYVGYSQGARNPAEFAVTGLIRLAEANMLAVERCDGTYLEDQDMWWLNGIFRDVALCAWPRVHVVDYCVRTLLGPDYRDAKLSLSLQLSEPCLVEIRLHDPQGREVLHEAVDAGERSGMEFAIANPAKWTAETPNLFTLSVALPSSAVAQRVGFRAVAITDGVFLVNGSPVKLRGVNRHEHHPDTGRTVPYDFMRRDLLLMKRHNVNAVRTSHYPHDPRMYDVADELGLWVLDEADLECHGFRAVDGSQNAHRFLSDNPAWEAAYLDRAKQLVLRDRNHACVVMWSLGNEAFYGANHAAMYHWIKNADPTRPVHYEQDRDARSVDVYGVMYPDPDWVVERGKLADLGMPLILCEFAHAMGNGPGILGDYVDAFYEYPTIAGGFVWEWANHGLRTRNARGETYMGYGGDFGDVPNDRTFVMDGLCFSDHTPTPGLLEYRKVIEPVQALGFDREGVLTVVNRYDTLTLDHLFCTYVIATEHGTSEEVAVAIPTGTKPHAEAGIRLSPAPDRGGGDGEAYLRLSFRLRDATAWAAEGFEVATGEILLSGPPPQTVFPQRAPRHTVTPPLAPVPTLAAGPDTTSITVVSASRTCRWKIDAVTGQLDEWTKTIDGNDESLMVRPMATDFYRAQTDNDRPFFGKNWKTSKLDLARHHARRVEWREVPSGAVEVTVHGRIAPPVLAWAVDVITTYTFRGDSLRIRFRGTPHGPRLPLSLARIGLTLGLRGVEGARWWGRGPGESYRDKKQSQLFGVHDRGVDDLWVDYEVPQEGGNRTDVRWVELYGSSSRSARSTLVRADFGRLPDASFNVMRVTTTELDDARHPFDLHAAAKRRGEGNECFARLDWAHHGLGTGSCGPATREEHRLDASREFDFTIILE